MEKAKASRFLENLIAALIGCLLGSTGGAVIWIWSTEVGMCKGGVSRRVEAALR
jgi:hypothetical protein